MMTIIDAAPARSSIWREVDRFGAVFDARRHRPVSASSVSSAHAKAARAEAPAVRDIDGRGSMLIFERGRLETGRGPIDHDYFDAMLSADAGGCLRSTMNAAYELVFSPRFHYAAICARRRMQGISPVALARRHRPRFSGNGLVGRAAPPIALTSPTSFTPGSAVDFSDA